MIAGFMEFRGKEIINITNGEKLGYADDVMFDTKQAAIVSIVVYGRLRFFGLFGRQEDIEIPWEDIDIIGEDTILVKTGGALPKKHISPRGNLFEKLFN